MSRFWRRRERDEAIEERLIPDPETGDQPAEEETEPRGPLGRLRRRLAKNAPIFKSSSFIALEVAATIVALAFGVVGLSWWWLSQGPQEVAFLEPYIESELSEARGGRPVDIDRVELSWTAHRGLQLSAVDVKVQDARGLLLSTSREVAIGISPWHLLLGQVRVTRADFAGGDMSIVRKADGATHIALGPPGSTPDFIVAPPRPNETLSQRINRVLDSLSETLRPVGEGGSLTAISVREAHLTVIDESGGGEWQAQSASAELAREGAELSVSVRARLEGPRGPAPASLRITTNTSFSSARIEFATDDARPRAILSPAMMGLFAGLDAPMDARITIGIDRQAGITQLDGDVSLGRGSAELPGGRFAIDGGRLHGAYDLERDVLTIDQISLAGARNRIDGAIRIENVSSLIAAESAGVSPFTASLPSVRLDVPGVFDEGAAMRNLRVEGAFDRGKGEITYTRISANVGAAALNATGRLYWAPASDGIVRPGLSLDGAIEGVAKARDILALWPHNAAPGARGYLGHALVGADLNGTTFKIDMTPDDSARGHLRNEALNIAFTFNNAEFKYLPAMSPVLAGRGRTLIQGNHLDVWFDTGRVETLAASEGHVEVTEFTPRGIVIVRAKGDGDVRSMIRLLEQEPLNLRGRLPLQTDTIVGAGSFLLTIRRPVGDDGGAEDMRFTINGQLDGVGGLERQGRITFADGALTVRGDQRAVTVAGRARVGASTANVEWVETLGRALETPSRYQISGEFDIADLKRLGYPLDEFADGRVTVTLRGAGRGDVVDNANITVDFRNASIALTESLWTKRVGVPAAARFDVGRAEDGSIVLSNMNLQGPGLTATQGELRVSAGNQLTRMLLPRVQITDRADARFAMERSADGAFVYDISGAFLDATPWMEDEPQSQTAQTQHPRAQAAQPQRRQTTAQRRAAQRAAQAAPPPQPTPDVVTPTALPTPPPAMRGRVRVDRIGLRGGAVQSHARLEFSVANNSLVMLSAEGRDPAGGSFTLGLGPRPNDPQGRIAMRADDAGFAAQALTGSTNVRGGTATADGTWVPGAAPRAVFTVRMRNFTAVRVPAMTRLFSSIASLEGLAEMLGGDGISFTSLEAPVTMQGARIAIGDSRAAGPSLGITASGTYDTRADNLDIDGVVVPSFGLNSMLGNLPVVGELFVSREGEGVLGITYSMDGPLATARVGVNPLSALAPGIFRRIFESSDRRETAD